MNQEISPDQIPDLVLVEVCKMPLSLTILAHEQVSSVRNKLSPNKNLRHPDLGHQASKSVSYKFLLFMNHPVHNILLKLSKWIKMMAYRCFTIIAGCRLMHSAVILVGRCYLSGPALPAL